MPFFEGAHHFSIKNPTMSDVKGNQTNYNGNVTDNRSNYDNTTTTNTIDSYNDNSRRTVHRDRAYNYRQDLANNRQGLGPHSQPGTYTQPSNLSNFRPINSSRGTRRRAPPKQGEIIAPGAWRPPNCHQPQIATAPNEEGLQFPRSSGVSAVAEPAYQRPPIRESNSYAGRDLSDAQHVYPTYRNPRHGEGTQYMYPKRQFSDAYFDQPIVSTGDRCGDKEVNQAAQEEGYEKSYDLEEDGELDFQDAFEEPSPSQFSNSYSRETFPDHITRASSSPSTTTLPSSSSLMNPSSSRPAFPHSNTTPAGYSPANDVPQGQSKTKSKNPFRQQ